MKKVLIIAFFWPYRLGSVRTIGLAKYLPEFGWQPIILTAPLHIKPPEQFARKLLEDYHFSTLAIGEYTKDRKYLRINSVDELLQPCKGEKTANLFLEC